MAVYMATDIDRHRQARYMGGVRLDVYRQSCDASAESARSDSKAVDLFEQFLLLSLIHI